MHSMKKIKLAKNKKNIYIKETVETESKLIKREENLLNFPLF